MYQKIRIFSFLSILTLLLFFLPILAQMQTETYFTQLLAQTQTIVSDPLLRDNWYEDQEKEEAIIYNKVMKYFRPNAHFVWKTDLYGRNYKFYKDGRVEFLVDRDFREVFPDVSELDVHISEAKVMAERGEPYSAIRLLKGVGLCYRFQFGKLVPEGYKTATEELSRLIKHMAHKKMDVDSLTDPYGCVKRIF